MSHALLISGERQASVRQASVRVAKAVETTAASSRSFAVGDKVSHAVHGLGVVKGVNWDSHRGKPFHVRFENGEEPPLRAIAI